MKRASVLFLCALSALTFSACGKEQSDPQTYTLTVSFVDAATIPLQLGIYDAEGWQLGTSRIAVGGNSLPKTDAPVYLSCELPVEYDCTVVRADGSDVTLKMYAAKEWGGEYVHSYTVFLENAEPQETYSLQICDLAEEGGTCRRALFTKGKASLSLPDGEYTLEIMTVSDIVYERPLTFSYTDPRFCVIDLNETEG